MAHTRTWNAAYEATPPNTQNASQGAQRIRELKTDIEERLTMDHVMDETDDDGYHVQVTLEEQGAAPGNLTNKGRLYTLDVSGLTELHYIDAAGTAFQITKNGKLLLLDTQNSWTAGQGMAEKAIAYSTPLTLDSAEANRFAVGILTGNLTLEEPTNPIGGQVVVIKLTQDATGGRTLTFGSTIYGNSSNDWALSTAGNSVDELVLEYDGDSSKWRALALHKDINNAL